MIPLSFKATLLAITEFLDKERIPYMVIGAVARALWGQPRVTADLDFTVWVSDEELPEFVSKIVASYQTDSHNPTRDALERRHLSLKSVHGLDVDLIFGLLPFEEGAIHRAVPINIESHTINVCTPEDLILHKVFSERPKDRIDVEDITNHQIHKLDLSYLEPRIQELAQVMERPDILTFWTSVRDRAQRLNKFPEGDP